MKHRVSVASVHPDRVPPAGRRRRIAGVTFGLLVLAAMIAAQSSLTARDYDTFYDRVILGAKNGTKAEWLASYDPVVDFVGSDGVRADCWIVLL